MTTDTERDIGTAEVCLDCYFAHHYGATEHRRPATEAELTHHEHEKGNTYHAREVMGLTFHDDGTVTEWFAGEFDTRAEGGEPLAHLPEYGQRRGDWVVTGITDFTCSDHFYGQTVTPDDWDGEGSEPVCDHCGQTGWEDGITVFTWRSCDGCNSHLGGSRHRLAIHRERRPE
jgi:hypothetical protein